MPAEMRDNEPGACGLHGDEITVGVSSERQRLFVRSLQCVDATTTLIDVTTRSRASVPTSVRVDSQDVARVAARIVRGRAPARYGGNKRLFQRACYHQVFCPPSPSGLRWARAGRFAEPSSGEVRRSAKRVGGAPSSVVEHLTFNQGVPGSIPGGPTKAASRPHS